MQVWAACSLASACSTFTPTEDAPDGAAPADASVEDVSSSPPDAATSDGDRDATVVRYVFVTASEVLPSSPDGVIHFDQICTAAARASMVADVRDRSFAAWMSTNDAPASDHVGANGFSGVYELVDHTQVAKNGAELVSGALRHGIDRTESGGLRDGGSAWTGTTAAGNVDMVKGNCGSWNKAAGYTGASGVVGSASPDWTSADARTCTEAGPIYCVEVVKPH